MAAVISFDDHLLHIYYSCPRDRERQWDCTSVGLNFPCLGLFFFVFKLFAFLLKKASAQTLIELLQNHRNQPQPHSDSRTVSY